MLLDFGQKNAMSEIGRKIGNYRETIRVLQAIAKRLRQQHRNIADDPQNHAYLIARLEGIEQTIRFIRSQIDDLHRKLDKILEAGCK